MPENKALKNSIFGNYKAPPEELSKQFLSGILAMNKPTLYALLAREKQVRTLSPKQLKFAKQLYEQRLLQDRIGHAFQRDI